MAVVLTKFDVILNIPEFSSLLGNHIKKPSVEIRGGKVNANELREISNQVQYFFLDEKVNESQFVSKIESNFTDFMFFGVSSYGTPPIDEHIINKIEAHRILDPIVWLFLQKKFI